MSKEKIKVYLYTRVSTTMQIDGYSLDAQKTKMKAFCEMCIRDSTGNPHLRAAKCGQLWSYEKRMWTNSAQYSAQIGRASCRERV